MKTFFFLMLILPAIAGSVAELVTESVPELSPELTYKGKGLTLRLVCSHSLVKAGDEVTLGVAITHEEGYHTYWKSPGIVGLPVKLEWALRDGLSVKETTYPYPERVNMAEYPAYGYERDVVLLSKVVIPSGYQKAVIQGEVKVSWMCCAVSCCPDYHTFPFSLPVGDESVSSCDEPLLLKALNELPTPHPELRAELLSKRDADPVQLRLVMPAGLLPVHLFSEDNQSSSDVKQQFKLLSGDVQKAGEAVYELELARYEFSPQGEQTFPCVLETKTGFFTLSPVYRTD